MLSNSQIRYQNLKLRNLTSNERNQRKELSIIKLRYMILKELLLKQNSKSAMSE